jgi:hypothetical protein
LDADTHIRERSNEHAERIEILKCAEASREPAPLTWDQMEIKEGKKENTRSTVKQAPIKREENAKLCLF